MSLADRRQHARIAAAGVPQPHQPAISQLHDAPRGDSRLQPRPAAAQVRRAKMNRKSLALWISLMLLTVGGASAQTTMPVELEAGYRWLSLSGSSDMYRTQINERDGFLIRALTISGNDTPFTDHFRLDATDLGAGPAGALRLDFGKTSLY